MKLASELGITVFLEAAHATNNQENNDSSNDSYNEIAVGWLRCRKCEGLRFSALYHQQQEARFLHRDSKRISAGN
jgi:hypothetical protein